MGGYELRISDRHSDQFMLTVLQQPCLREKSIIISLLDQKTLRIRMLPAIYTPLPKFLEVPGAAGNVPCHD